MKMNMKKISITNLNQPFLIGVIMLVVGFACGQMSASLFQADPWLLSAFVAGLGLALGYVARQSESAPAGD
jgi:hypothetical protein